MVNDLPIVTFDTSAHNKLVEDAPRAEPLLTGLKSGLFFRFSDLSVGELFACPDAAKRAALLVSCQRLQGGQSDCLSTRTAHRDAGKGKSGCLASVGTGERAFLR
jgi:hypothetical protein